MTIRLASTDDLEALASLNLRVQELHVQAHPEIFKPGLTIAEIASAFHEKMKDPNSLWLIAEDPSPVGYLYAELQDRPESWFKLAQKICNISHLAVHPEAHRKGVAKALVIKVIELARARGYERIDIDFWSFNETAREAFQKLGFKVYNERMTQ